MAKTADQKQKQLDRKARRRLEIQERQRAKAKARRKQQLTRTVIIGGIALASIALAAWTAFQFLAPKPGIETQDLGNQHINDPEGKDINYPTDPPTSGPHTPYITTWGIHSQPIPKAIQVHNLEDGGVLVQYNKSATPETIGNLEKLVRQYPDHVILAPYPDMDATIALTAWARIQKLDKFDEALIKEFINAFRGKDHHRPNLG